MNREQWIIIVLVSLLLLSATFGVLRVCERIRIIEGLACTTYGPLVDKPNGHRLVICE